MSDTSHETLCQAQDMMQKAADFYHDATDACHDALGAEFFQWLGDEKTKAVEAMTGIGARLGAGSTWADACPLPQEEPAGAVGDFRNKAAGQVVSGQACLREVEALRTAIDMERGLTGFFQTRAAAAKDGVEKAFMEHMLGESRRHVLLVEDMLAYYEDPAAWAGGMGRVELDGA